MPMASNRPYSKPRVPPSASPPTSKIPLSSPSSSTVLTEFIRSLFSHYPMMRRGGRELGSQNPPHLKTKNSGRLAGDVDLNLPRLRHFLLGEGHGQHTVLVVGLHALGIHRVGQTEDALKGSVRPFQPVPAAFALL